MSLFTLEDSVLIFQLLNYQITHLPNSRLHQSCLDRKREQNSRNRWHNALALAFQNYQLPMMAITSPPPFLSQQTYMEPTFMNEQSKRNHGNQRLLTTKQLRAALL